MMRLRRCVEVCSHILGWMFALSLLLPSLAYGQTVVVNEFMAQNGSTLADEFGEYDDWIELYNPGVQAVDVGGFFLTDDLQNPTQWRIPMDRPDLTTVQKGAFLLIWADGQAGQGPLHASFKLQASGEAIGLFARDGVTRLDSMTFTAQDADRSLARVPDGAATWQVADRPTPGRSNLSRRPRVVINEIMYHGRQVLNQPEDLAAEFIELFNAGPEAADLSGWRLTRNVRYSFPAGTSLAAGGILVVTSQPEAFAGLHPWVGAVAGGWEGSLGNSGDTIELVDRDGVTVSRVTYSDEGEWAERELGPVDHNHRGWQWSEQTDGGGRSLELINPALSDEVAQNWAASKVDGGTPGLVNSVASGDVAPFILDVSHWPIIPGPVDTVTVTARLMGEQTAGVGCAVLYRADGQSSFTRLAMADDGGHGDDLAGDGIYGAALPPQLDGTIVEFYVEARDSQGRIRTWPAPSEVDGTPQQVTNALYQVSVAFDLDAAWVPGSQPVYYLIMTEKERAELALLGSRSNGEEDSDATMNGTFISLDGTGMQLRYTVGIRNRGHGTRTGPPNNVHVHFPHDRTWKGLGSLNFNCRYTHAQIVGSAIHHLAGDAAPDALPVQLRINGANLATTGSPMFGVYVGLEAFDDEWAKKHFPQDSAGNLYTCFRTDGASIEAEMRYEGSNPDAYRNRYFKANNVSQDDWSDLINLFNVLNNAPDATYFEDVSKVINVSQWLRYIALDSFFLNYETGLNRGIGDDYFMYRGGLDSRFVLVPHDLDTILGEGSEHGNMAHSIFSIVTGPTGSGVDGLKRFLGRPEIIPLYYQALLDVARDVFNPDKLDPVFEQVLGGFAPRARIDAMKQFVRDRRASVLAQIPQKLTVASNLPVVEGFPWTADPMAALSGTANAARTRGVLVNGSAAAWTPLGGRWAASGIVLRPGINRIIVQAFGEADATGDLIEEAFFDIWYEGSHESEISGTLAGSRTLDAASGPWHVAATLTVPAGATLTIESGATLFFEPGTSLVVKGRLIAQGSPYERIRLATSPGSAPWAGCEFIDTMEDNAISYADMEYCDAGSCAVRADGSRLWMDHVTWGHHSRCVLLCSESSVTLSNSVLPGLAGVEGIRVAGLPQGSVVRFEGNQFGPCTGTQAMVAVSGGKRPGPIAQFINNIFAGGGGPCIGLAGADALIEGNVFRGVHGGGPGGQASAAVGIGAEGEQVSDPVIVRNLFYDVDRAILSRDGGFITAVNNTIVHATVAAVTLYEPSLVGTQAAGFHGDGNLFYDVAQVFENPDWSGHPVPVTLNRSMLPFVQGDPWVSAGVGNLQGDPQLVRTSGVADPRVDFTLLPTSPAIASGPGGRDMGGLVPAGASISGEPVSRTWRDSATLSVGGSEIKAYRFRVNDGPWSQEVLRPEPILPFVAIPAMPPIGLTHLGPGIYTVYVASRDAAGTWQDEAAATASRTWTVDPGYSQLRINEVMAMNQSSLDHEGTFPDWVELAYDGPAALDLSGMKITDDPNGQASFVFPAGTRLSAGQYLMVYADSGSGTSGLHMGLALDHEGDGVWLYDRTGNLLDSVQFGLQLPDLSIGRSGQAGQWSLNRPTPGAENVSLSQGDPRMLRINEWLASGQVLFADDFIELCNPNSSPVDLGGMVLADHLVTSLQEARIPALTFIAGKGDAVFRADHSRQSGHLGFRLPAECGMIGLYDRSLVEVDRVFYGPQTTDVSQGRLPDGSQTLEFMVLPTPGIANPQPAKISTLTLPLVEEQSAKRVWVPTAAIADSWRGGQPFDDSAWMTCTGGPGGVGYDRDTTYRSWITLDTESLMYGSGKSPGCYLRIPFTIDAETLAGLSRLTLNMRYDDGFVAYLNGQEVARKGFAGTPAWNSRAASSVEASLSSFGASIDITSFKGQLKVGDNILAVHAMNSSATSSDFLISVAMEGVVTHTESRFLFENDLLVLNGLRVTEIMYDPPAGNDLDFIELQNVLDTPFDLAGVRFTDGIDFVFPQMTLAPGQFVVVAGSLSAFVAEYGDSVPVAGQYSGKLSDSGEALVLTLASPLEAAVLRFSYNGQWHPRASGGGESLVISDPLAPPATWNDWTSWHTAAPSPGRP